MQRLASSGSDVSMTQEMDSDVSRSTTPMGQGFHQMAGHFPGKYHEETIDVVGMGNDGMPRISS